MLSLQCKCGEFCAETRRLHLTLVDVTSENIGALFAAAERANAVATTLQRLGQLAPQPQKHEAN